MNKKQMMKRIIELSLLAGLFLPIVANADSYTVNQVILYQLLLKRRTQRLMQLLRKIRLVT